jgi:sulfur-carrier protein
VARGTIRYWAAARAAAGVAEDPYDAETLAEALAQARALRGAALAKVLDRCSYVVDDAPVGGRAHDTVRLSDGGSVECLPPFAGGAPTPAAQPAAVPKRSWATRPKRRAATGVAPMIVSDLTRSTP